MVRSGKEIRIHLNGAEEPDFDDFTSDLIWALANTNEFLFVR